jgi:hypothetical protein
MMQKRLALLGCAFVATFTAMSGNHGRQPVERAAQALSSRLGVSFCSFGGPESEDDWSRGYMVLLNVNGKRIGGLVEFDDRGPVGLAAGTIRGAGCR